MAISLILVTILSVAYGHERPKLAPFSPSIKPIVGGRTSIICQPISGSSPLQISWLKDGKELIDSSTTKIRTIEESSLLIIDSISSNHSGNYTCKVSNTFGSDSYSTELKIEGSPNWIEKPKNVKAGLDEHIVLKCYASGYPKPKVQWKRLEGSSWAVIDSIGSTLYETDDTKLIIRKTNQKHSGMYGCSVSNEIEPSLWAEFELTINGKFT